MQIRTRFAPSPTGRMHLGNLWIALLNWLWTKQHRGTLILRMEDIDQARCRKEYEKGILEDLAWMGLTFDEIPGQKYSYGSVIQSERYPAYEEIFQTMRRNESIYPCYCNRSRIHQIASAPHEGEEAPLYDGHCRFLTDKERGEMTKKPSWRVKMEDGDIAFMDIFLGNRSRHLRAGQDDFLIRRADGLIAYQLAVSMDDGKMGITHVFRGNDLLPSTPFQVYLMKKMNFTPPVYGHLPLLVDKEGTRLSKRQQGITIQELRDKGFTPENLTGYLLFLAGSIGEPRPMRLEEALQRRVEDFPRLKKRHIVVDL